MVMLNQVFSQAAGTLFQSRRNWIVLLSLGVGISSFYSPAWSAYFISDDFQYLSYLVFNIQSLLKGEKWDFWLIGGIDGYLYFRPLGHALMFLDFLIWHLTPWGYHLTSLLLHLFASFEIYLLTKLITRRWRLAWCVALLFASMPIHSGAVSWIAARYDVLAGLFCFTSLIFFVLARQRASVRFYLISLVAFALAVSSKETAIPLPVAIFFYDVFFSEKRLRAPSYVIKYHLPFWLVVAVRLVFFGHGYQGLNISQEKIGYWIGVTLSNVLTPLPSEISTELKWLFTAAIVLSGLIFRLHRPVLFALIWTAVMAMATLTSGPSERSFYLPSFGAALVVGSVLARLIDLRRRALKGVGFVALVGMICVYGAELYARNQDMYRAGEIAEAIPTQVRLLHPVLPKEARLVFVGVPDQTPRGTLVYITGFPNVLNIAYRDQSLAVLRVTQFPVWLNTLDRTFYFQVDHRRVTERVDLIQTLKERARCENCSAPFLEWKFTEGVSDWELWNQLSGAGNRDGALVLRSEGSDPIMASPPIDISSLAIGEIQVTMRVRATKPILQGEWYWLASGQHDFSPGLKATFQVFADDEWHTYHADLARNGMLLMRDRITRIRLDPVDAPAEIAIRSITIFTHCSSLQGEQCICVPQ